jgi:hypothetical protein
MANNIKIKRSNTTYKLHKKYSIPSGLRTFTSGLCPKSIWNITSRVAYAIKTKPGAYRECNKSITRANARVN